MSKTSIANNDIIKAIIEEDEEEEEYEDEDDGADYDQVDEGPGGGAFASWGDFWNYKER